MRGGELLPTELSSVFKTVDLLLGIPPLNLYDAAATDLLELFEDAPRVARAERGFESVAVRFDTRAAEAWRRATSGMRFAAPDEQGLDLREAIFRTEEFSRKKAEGRH